MRVYGLWCMVEDSGVQLARTEDINCRPTQDPASLVGAGYVALPPQWGETVLLGSESPWYAPKRYALLVQRK